MRDHLKAKGYSVELVLGNWADDDIIYMSTARYFISTGGGFSSMIQAINAEMGGRSFGNARAG